MLRAPFFSSLIRKFFLECTTDEVGTTCTLEIAVLPQFFGQHHYNTSCNASDWTTQLIVQPPCVKCPEVPLHFAATICHAYCNGDFPACERLHFLTGFCISISQKHSKKLGFIAIDFFDSRNSGSSAEVVSFYLA